VDGLKLALDDQQLSHQDTNQHVALVTRLAHFIAGLNADLDLPTLLQRISDSSCSLLEADLAAYVVIDGPEFVISSVSGLSEQLVGVRVAISETAVGALIADQLASLVGEPSHYPNSSLLLSPHLVQFHRMAVALTRVGGDPAGALYVMFRDEERDVTPSEVAVLELFADAAGTALANASAHADVVAQREHERAILDATLAGMAVIGPNGLVRQWNPAAERVTGLPASDVVGQPLPYACGESPIVHQLPSGTWIEVTSAPIGNTGELVVDIHDITPSKQLEAAKDFFLAVASHELRTPITVIQGFSATLASRWTQLDDADRRDAVERIAERARALSALVEQLLLGARAGTADFQVHPVPFQLAGLLQTAVAGFQTLTDHHELVLRVPRHLPAVLADPSATEIVVGQLIENAIKYSPEGGRVEIGITVDGAGDGTVDGAVGDGRMVISVADEGIGLRDGEPERIFDRFFQAGIGDSRRFGGVGLGLYIVRRLVESQNGTVHARPRAGGGSVFEFSLPLAP
jgi:nitrogen-specific signal transduction histidine kinase